MSNTHPSRIHTLGRLLPSTLKIHQNQEVYGVGGISPTIKAVVYKDPIKIVVERKVKNGRPDAEADGKNRDKPSDGIPERLG